MRLDDTRYAYVTIEDAHLRAISARWEGDRVRLVLDDGSDEELAYDTLTLLGGDALYCRVRGGRLRARLSTAAQAVVGERIVEDGAGFALEAVGRRWPIAVVVR